MIRSAVTELQQSAFASRLREAVRREAYESRKSGAIQIEDIMKPLMKTGYGRDLLHILSSGKPSHAR